MFSLYEFPPVRGHSFLDALDYEIIHCPVCRQHLQFLVKGVRYVKLMPRRVWWLRLSHLARVLTLLILLIVLS